MNTINSFYSGLKKFMIRFNGVATKYLDNYVNQFREFRDKIDTFNQLLQLQGCYRLVDLRNRRVCFENMFQSNKSLCVPISIKYNNIIYYLID